MLSRFDLKSFRFLKLEFWRQDFDRQQGQSTQTQHGMRCLGEFAPEMCQFLTHAYTRLRSATKSQNKTN